MQILLANAKIMYPEVNRQPCSTPLFQTVANELATEMSMLSVDELSKQLDCSRAIAAEKLASVISLSTGLRRGRPCLPTTGRLTNICALTR